MHGYQVMTELSDRTNGAWRPSPGSVYPVLQQLTDEGLVVSNEDAGKKVFSLTSAGSDAAAEALSQPRVWDRFIEADGGVDLREAVGGLAAAAKQVGTMGTPEQATQAAAIITEARKRLYQLLAE